MNLFSHKSQLIFRFNSLVWNQLLNRSQTLCLSAINQSIVNKKSQTIESNISTKSKNDLNKSRKEETISFDSRFGDTFGNLSGNDHRFKRLLSEELPEDEDNYDVLEIKRGPKMSESGYQRVLTQLIRRKPIQLRKALELHNKMISEDRIPPNKCLYTLLISGCAKLGYTQKAFELFDELLKFELRPTKPAITALFNSCAECPFHEYGLQKARYLKEWMELEGFVANTFHYHSMIKAFGKLGDIKTAFEIVDLMVSNGQTTTDETFAMLLMGCISDKESGFYHTIKIVRRMKFHNLSLTIYTFNLLLRAVRDCGIGSEDNLKSLTKDMYSQSQQNYCNNNFQNNNEVKHENPNCDQNVSKSLVRIPNFLFPNALESNVIQIRFDSLCLPHNRFMLLGGIEGFIKMMNEYKVKPNINTLTLMTELIDLNEESEKQILNLLNTYRIRADTDFFNILLKKICVDRGIVGTSNILSLMNQKGLQPNIMTFGVLSLGCNSFALGRQLLYDMEVLHMKANIQIIGALLYNAVQINNIQYINYLIDYMKNNDIKPDQRIVEKLEIIKIKFQKILTEFDSNDKQIPEKYKTDYFREEFAKFKQKYEKWILNETLEEEDHPWDQFKFDEIPNKKGMHSFVKFMKQKINKRKGNTLRPMDYYEEDDLYD